jgi:hypothetical protein
MQQEHLTVGSEDEDGTITTKTRENLILLHCPNCRTNLSATICDTVLLRKVDELQAAFQEEVANGDDLEELLGIKKAMETDVNLLHEIAQARVREARFWEEKTSQQEARFELEDESVHEEWGYEVDLRLGPHESIKLPLEHSNVYHSHTQHVLDKTLLQGLDSVMSTHDQKQATRLLTSGDTNDLAKAAKLLSSIADTVYHQPATPTSVSAMETRKESRVVTRNRQDLIYRLIEDGRRARQRKVDTGKVSGKKNEQIPPFHDVKRHIKSYTVKAAKHRQIEQQLRAHLAYMKKFPLPVRMPKYAEFILAIQREEDNELQPAQIVKALPFRFCNDVWNGTVADAFCKIDVNPKRDYKTKQGKNYNPTAPKSVFIDNYLVTQHKRHDNPGVRSILDGDDVSRDRNIIHRGDFKIDTEHPRVLIASVVDPEASKKGILKGDVVTHLNDTELRDVTVDELIALIWSLCCEEKSSVLQFVFNADRATAEALKMRAQVSDKSFW